MVDNCVQTTKQLLKVLNIAHTSKYIENNILSHPDHPSLLSISETLTKYNIETLAVKIDSKKLNEMPMPCIVQVAVNGATLFFVVKNVLEKSVNYYDDKNKLIIAAKEDF